MPADPLDACNIAMGAVVDSDQMSRVLGYIEDGRKEGATIAAGGSQVRQESGGSYIEPTVFTGVQQRHEDRAGGNLRPRGRGGLLQGRGRSRGNRQ
jgi:acyl-CoA reductase-like NAD-dependent aldehyde dehydrogenase